MTDDEIQGYRQLAASSDNANHLSRAMKQILDEIERLRAKLDTARAALETIAGWANHANPNAIEDRARKALEVIS